MLKTIGAVRKEEEVEFCVWAPFRKNVEVEIFSPDKKTIPMQRNEYGYWIAKATHSGGDVIYNYNLDKEVLRPDPASRYQPEGVHGPSQVWIDDFEWTDSDFAAPCMADMIIYELHTGTFTPKNNFEGIKEKIGYLKELDINTIELMPVAQFPGNRNWGYDGVYPFAVQNSYGGPSKLKELINECHNQGISVIMDVVYNHLGPEGNYLNDFGPYFTDKYSTPWGKALNFDDAYSDHVRNYFYQNAIMWFREYHINALRLDAVHAIYDASANPFLKELKKITEKISAEDGKNYQLIAESDLNDVKVVDEFEKGGYNHDAQWMDDFHHSVHTLITGENNGYYSDFGKLEQLVNCMNNGFVYDGIYSHHRKKLYGNSSAGIQKSKFVVCIQNHDQVGNRVEGDRLTNTVSTQKLQLAAACMFLSPYVPMLFMGEEYGEENPFLYFISHSEKNLIKAVREGRKKEFSSFDWKGKIPDPQSEETFKKCILNLSLRSDEKKKLIFGFYKFLISLRKTHPLLKPGGENNFKADNNDNLLTLTRQKDNITLTCYLNFSDKSFTLTKTGNGKQSILLNTGKRKEDENEFLDEIAPFAVIITETTT